MATINWTKTEIQGGGHVITWTNMANGDVGQAFVGGGAADRSVQIRGTWGTGGSTTLKGSNDGTNYLALTDPQGNAITKTADALEAVMELAAYTRPEVTAGDGTTAITVSLFVKK